MKMIAGQRVVSHFIPQEGQFRYMAFTTAIGNDRVIATGIGIGDGPHNISRVGAEALNVVMSHSRKDAECWLCLCRDEKTAKQRLRRCTTCAT